MFVPKEASAMIVRRDDGKILILKRSDAVDSYRGRWNLPAGGVDYNESAIDCAIRECFEETSLSVMKESVSFIGTFDISSSSKIKSVHYFATTEYSGDVKIDWESSDYMWVDLSEIYGENFIPIPSDAVRAIEAWAGGLR